MKLIQAFERRQALKDLQSAKDHSAWSKADNALYMEVGNKGVRDAFIAVLQSTVPESKYAPSGSEDNSVAIQAASRRSMAAIRLGDAAQLNPAIREEIIRVLTASAHDPSEQVREAIADILERLIPRDPAVVRAEHMASLSSKAYDSKSQKDWDKANNSLYSEIGRDRDVRDAYIAILQSLVTTGESKSSSAFSSYDPVAHVAAERRRMAASRLRDAVVSNPTLREVLLPVLTAVANDET
jgi:hypothetical protein